MSNLENRLSSRLDALSPAQRQALLQKLKQKKAEPVLSILNQPMKPASADRSHFPLSFGQQRLWFLEQFDPGKPTYHIASALKLSGPLDCTLLEKTLSMITQRHQILRSVFNENSEGISQQVLPENPCHLPVVDLQGQSPEHLLNQAINTPFDLKNGPLFRLKLIKTSDDAHILSLVLHHIIADAWSCGILLAEISMLYSQLYRGAQPLQSSLNCQYGDYVLWQQSLLNDPVVQKQRNYWHQQLQSVKNIQLPLDNPRPPSISYRGDFHRLTLDAQQSEALSALCQNQQVTLFHGLMSLYQTLLFRICQHSDFCIGTPVAGRQHEDTHPMIGFFVNSLAICNDADRGVSFNELLSRVKSTTLDAQCHQDIPFESLVDDLVTERDTSFSPIFQVFFSYNPDSIQDQIRLPGISIEPINNDSKTAKFDLSLIVTHDDQGLCCHFEYNSDIFQPETIQHFAQCFEQLLAAACQQPNTAIEQLALVNPAQMQHLLALGANPAPAPAVNDIATLIENQVAKTPDKLAIMEANRQISFAQLNERANQLACTLIQKGVQPNDKVGLYLHPGIDLMIALLATIKIQAVYVPMDTMFPKERLSFMAEHAHMKVLICQQSEPLAWAGDTDIIALSALNLAETDLPEIQTRNPERTEITDQPLYLLYTSGSTGKPKAAMVSHQNESNLLHWYANAFSMSGDDKILVFSALGFDLTQKNLLAPLCFGAELHFCDSPYYDPEAICDTISKRNISWVNCAPSAFYPIIEHCHDFQQLKSLRQLFLGGESIQISKLKPWLNHKDCQSKLVNMYGPTECTDIATAFTYQNNNTSHLPIGLPAQNVQLYVMDQQQQLLPQGAIGELCIAGASVGLGYYGNEALNDEKFIRNPLSESTQDKTLYRTGDLVRFTRHGLLEFVARNDSQMKVRGFRIEPGDIESQLKQLPDIDDAVVCLRKVNDNNQLIAFLVSGKPLDHAASYKRQLIGHLADFMIPIAFFTIDAIPLNSNGKVDRKQLPAVELSRLSEQAYVPPRNALEAELVDIWQSLLAVEQIGVLDNFFESGGHSLLATQLLIRIRERFFIDLPMRTLFEISTIEGLAEIIYAMQDSLEDDQDDTFEEGII